MDPISFLLNKLEGEIGSMGVEIRLYGLGD